MNARKFPTAAIASLTTGVLLCKFEEMHEAAEYVAGGPVFTHQFPLIMGHIRDLILKQHPGLPTELHGVTTENYMDYRLDLDRRFGAEILIEEGDGASLMSPLDGTPADKPVIIVGG